MPPPPTIVWFRRDLRVEDNPALHAAAARGPVVPVYIWDEVDTGRWRHGGASRWWLHHSLTSLSETLRRLGSRLIVRRGNALTELRRLVAETGAGAVHWNRLFEPDAIARDKVVKQALRGDGLAADSFSAAMLFEPHTVANKSGNPYRVFTPFWAAIKDREVPKPLPAPQSLVPFEGTLDSLNLDDLRLLPTIAWAVGLCATWSPGEESAHTMLRAFLKGVVNNYPEARNLPSTAGTSRLSPALHFGEVGPRQLWHAVGEAMKSTNGAEPDAALAWLREVAWREFAHHLLYHFPETAEQPLRAEFASFPWRTDEDALVRWQTGQTGYPIVDAGMRELWHTGWMHNRVRMIVASFLVKDLLIPWQEGAAWFWDTLVDADLANNTIGWQWTAGCGADAAPYFRIFNPVSQGTRFDGAGDYVRRWVPELAKLPNSAIHAPWQADALTLSEAGVRLGTHYREPMVDHKRARKRALDSFARVKAAR